MSWRIRVQLLAWRPHASDERELYAAIATLAPAYTMVDLQRLRRLARLADAVHRNLIKGAVVECGTWRGGSLALLDWVFRRHDDARTLWAFDSFEGLPPPGQRDPVSAQTGFFAGWCAASEADVRRALAALDSSSELHIVPGWLSNTLPQTATGPIALLNVDVDWYDSVWTVLMCLYDRVVPGGIINFDDYGRWSGCDEAVRDFLRKRELSVPLVRERGHGAWLQKP